MIAAVSRHLHFAIRSIAKQPAQTAVIAVALGLGIGLTVTMYSVLHGIFLRGLPFERSERLLQLDCTNAVAGIERLPVSARDYFSWRETQSAFEDLGAWYGVGITVSGRGGPAERYNGAHISSNLLRLLRVQPALGRSFEAGDDTASSREIAISHTVWSTRYGSDPKILGRSIRVNGEEMTVIGVMPAGFEFPLSQDFWLPLGLDPTNAERRVGLQVVGRLAAGASLERAQAELDGLAAGLAAAYPDTNRDVGVVVRRYVDAYSDPEMRSYLNRMLAVVIGVFLVACANVANLLLTRSMTRAREVAIRKALGVTRTGLAAQFLTESLLLASAGGCLGLLLAYFATGSIQRVVKPILRSFWVDIRVDLPVVLFALALTFLAALLAGLLPVLRVSGPTLRQVLNEETAGASSLRLNRLGRALVTIQIALSCALVVPMGLMIKSVVRLQTTDYGFTTDDLLLAHVSLPADEYPDAQSWSRFFGELRRRLSATPQVVDVALASSFPDERMPQESFAVEGARYLSAAALPEANWVAVSPRFFATLDLSIVEGRSFRDSDDPGGEPVVIVGRSLADRYFARGGAIGRRIRIGGPDAEAPWSTIVGVAEDPFRSGLPPKARGLLPAIRGGGDEPVPDFVYLPRAQDPSRAASIAIRTRGNPLDLAQRVREEVAALDPNVPALFVRSMSDGLAETTWDFRLFTSMFTAFGLAALFLAMTGLYGMMALSVGRRTREFGVRMALGARGSDNVRLALVQGLSQVAVGLTLGLALAAVLARLLSAMLLGVEPWDPSVFAAVATVFVVAGVAACLPPAWRAARVHPIAAMRAA